MVSRIFVCLMLVAAAGLFATPAPAAQKGAVTDMTWGTNQLRNEKTAAAIADTRAQWTRINLSWRYAEPSKGTFDSQIFDQVGAAISLIRASGSRVILTVEQAPEWASGQTDIRYPPTDANDLGRFLQYAVPRFANEVDAWEVWNEPNHPHFWYPDPQTDPNACAAYGQLLRAAYPVIKAQDPDAVVLFAGLAYADFPYVERCYDSDPGIGAYFDAMALHPYATGGKAPEAIVDINPVDGRQDRDSFLGYREVRSSMAARGDAKPIWLTEFGWSTATDGHPLGNVSLETQADYVTRAYKLLEQDEYVPVATWYSLRNVGNDGPDWLSQLGLMWTDFTPKPAYYAFKAYTSPSPSPVTTPAPTVTTTFPAYTPAPNVTTVTPAPAASARTKTTITVASRRLETLGRTASEARRVRSRITGTLSRGPRSGSIKLRIQRPRANGTWMTMSWLRAQLTSGRFSKVISVLPGTRRRVRASFAGDATHSPSTSRNVQLSTRGTSQPRR